MIIIQQIPFQDNETPGRSIKYDNTSLYTVNQGAVNVSLWKFDYLLGYVGSLNHW